LGPAISWQRMLVEDDDEVSGAPGTGGWRPRRNAIWHLEKDIGLWLKISPLASKISP